MGVYIEIRDSNNSIEGRLEVGNSSDFPLTLSRKISDYKELTLRSGIYSSDFDVPMNRNNSDLLGHIHSANIKDTKQYFKEKTALIFNGETLIARGKLLVVESFYKNGTNWIRFNFQGDNLEWATELGELSLNEVNFVDSSFTFDANTIKSSWTNTADDSDYVFSFLYRGENHDNQASYIPQDFRPDLFVKRILTTSFNQIGWNLSSTFFDTSGFESLILPYFGTNEDNWNNSITEINERRITVGRTTDEFTNPIFGTELNRITGNLNLYNCQYPPEDAIIPLNVDSGGVFVDTNNVYNTSTYKFDNFNFFGSWTFEYDIKLKNPTHAPGAIPLGAETEVIIRVNGNGFYNESVIDVFPSHNPPARISGTLTTHINSGAEVFCYIKYLPPKEGDFYSINDCSTDRKIIQYTVDESSKATATISETITYGVNVSLQSVLPDNFTVLELLQDLTKMFYLFWRTDAGSKTVYVEPSEDFFKSISTAIDYTEKIDLSKGYNLIDFKSIYGKEITFRYATDGKDGYLSELNKINIGKGGQEWASLKEYDLGDDFEDGVTEISTNKVAATHYMQGNINEPWSARMWKNYQSTKPPFTTDFAPRILSYKYGAQTNINGNSRSFTFHNDGDLETITTIPYALDHSIKVNGVIEAPIDEVLTFHNNTLTLSNDKGLVEKYYSEAINFIKNGKTLSMNLILSYIDFIKIDFTKPIYFSTPEEISGYWRWQEIKDMKIDGSNTSVSCVLNKIINVEPLNINQVSVVDDGGESVPEGGDGFTVQELPSFDGITSGRQTTEDSFNTEL